MTLFKDQEIKEPNFDAIPQELKKHPKWMVWKAEPKPNKPDEMGKVPYNLKGYRASKSDPKNWITFEQAKTGYETGEFDGIGVVINRNDHLVCIDIDDLGDVSKAPEFINQSYTELSPSETGLHLWIRGQKPEWVGTKQNGIEIYGNEKDSFLTITGNIYINKPVMANQSLIVSIAEKYFPNQKPQEEPNQKKKVIKFKQVPDDVVINKMFDSKKGEEIKRLFSGDWTGYESQSQGDQALCNHLAYWTNNDTEQMDRLFRHSGLYREKWDEKRGLYIYGEMTIDKAIEGNQKDWNESRSKHQEELETTEDDKPYWWTENPNGTVSLRHSILAEWIIKKYHVIRYPDAQGELYFYNTESGIYELDKKGRCIRSFMRNEHEFKANQVKETMEYIYDMSPIQRETSKHYFAVNNGLLHLGTMEFKEFTPDEFLISKVPTNYNPDAFDSFVDDTLKRVTDGYEASIKNIEEMFGCVLYPKLLVPKMFYLYGRSANNGKSSLLYMIHKTFNLNGGNISAISPQKLATNTFAGASMYGKMANVIDDLPDLLIEDSGALKTVITGGYIEIERKNKDSETVEMSTTLITASNHFPNFREHGNQINRRLHIIPFDHDFSNDPDCLTETETNKRLSSENAREYVLKLSVDAVKRMLETTRKDKLAPNEKSDLAKQDFAEHNDPMNEFFIKYDKQYFLDEIGTNTFGEYQGWCMKHYISHPLGLKKFKEAVCLKYNLKWGTKTIKASTPSGYTTVRGFKEEKE
jgi:putative DNA primase/helicase